MKSKKVRLILLMICLSCLFLSGCSSKPKVSLKQLAKWENGVFISEIFELAVNPLSGWIRLNDYRIRSHIGELENTIYGTPDVNDDKFQKSNDFYPLIVVSQLSDDDSKESLSSFRIVIVRTEHSIETSVEDSDKLLQMIEFDYSNQGVDLNITFDDIRECEIGEQTYRCMMIYFNTLGINQLIAIRTIDGFVISLLFVTDSSYPNLIDEAIGAFSLYP